MPSRSAAARDRRPGSEHVDPIGGLCDWSVPESLSVSNISADSGLAAGSIPLGTAAYLISEVTSTTGTFHVTCHLAGGRVSGTLQVRSSAE